MIFEHLSDGKYLRYCKHLTKCDQSAYDLMMNTALYIHEKKYKLDYPFTLFCKIAKNNFINEKNKSCLTLEVDVPEVKESEPPIEKVLEILSKPARNKREFVTFEIYKLYLKFGTEQAVADYTNINRNTIHSQIQKFIRYARQNIHLD